MAGWFKVSAIEKTTKDLANIFKDYKLNSISSKLIKSFIATKANRKSREIRTRLKKKLRTKNNFIMFLLLELWLN